MLILKETFYFSSASMARIYLKMNQMQNSICHSARFLLELLVYSMQQLNYV